MSKQILNYKTHDIIYNHIRNGNQKTFVFIHGLGDSYSSFNNVINRLDDKKVDLLFYDLPGCGENKNVGISFEDNISLLNQTCSTIQNKIILIGHSLGGLIALLYAVRNNNSLIEKIITIEPSLLNGDFGFFKSVRMRPNGIGYEGLINSVRTGTNNLLYKKEYIKNLQNSSEEVFNNYVNSVCKNFQSYQERILNSDIKFTYIYGQNSPDQKNRQSLLGFSNIDVMAFDGAMHWVHIDAEDLFINFINSLL